MNEALMAGVLAGYGIAIPVGAIALLIVGVAMRCGFVCAFSAGAGAATADLGYALVAAVGGTAVSSHLAPWSGTIRLLSAVVLVAIAARGLWGLRRSGSQPERIEPASGRDLLATYGRFLGLTVINPLTVVYFAALVVGTGGVATGASSVLLFALGAFLASLSWQGLLAAAGLIGRRGLSVRARVLTLLGGNLLVVGFAIRILLDR